MQQYIQPLIQFFHLHPHFAGIFTFFVVFCEAMAVIGVVIPGSITMTAIGILIGSNVIPAGGTFLWGICGAILGDEISYLIGRYYKTRLHKVWPFRKHPEFLEKSEKFFSQHGGKSVFLGRFFGPMRAMIPMVAGMFNMPQLRFLVAAIPSSALWAVMYIMPGVLLGVLSLELPPKVATQFTLFALGAIIVFWGIVWLAHHFSKQVYYAFDRYIMTLWLYIRNCRMCKWFTNLLTDPREPDNHQQLSLLIFTIITIILFFASLQSALHHGIITILNEPIFNFLRSFRAPKIDHVMVAITSLSEPKAMIIFESLFLIWLIYKRYYYTAIHWFLLIVSCVLLVGGIKHFVYSPRPGGLLAHKNPSSIPSGHTAFAIAVFGFLAAVISRYLEESKRWIPYAITSTLVTLIIFSRLYLGAHWLSDIICSIFAGLSLAMLFTISYRREHLQNIALKQFISILLILFTVTWFIYNLVYFKKNIESYKLVWPTQTITLKELQSKPADHPIINLYRFNRLGRPVEAFNIAWLDSIEDIKNNLTTQGWTVQPTDVNLSVIIQRLLGNSIISQLPLLPQLFHNKPAVLVLTRTTNNPEIYLLLQLWESDITIADSKIPLWIGVLNYHKLESKILSLHYNHKKDAKFYGATEEFIPFLKNYKLFQMIYPLENQPLEIQDLNWNGKVILIMPKKI